MCCADGHEVPSNLQLGFQPNKSKIDTPESDEAHQLKGGTECPGARIYQYLSNKPDATDFALLLSAQYYRFFHPNRFLELSLLTRIAKQTTAPDVRFLVYHRRKQLQESNSVVDGTMLSSGRMSAIDRVVFQSHKVKADETMAECYRLHMQLWQYLLQTERDANVITTLGQVCPVIWPVVHQILTNVLYSQCSNRLQPPDFTLIKCFVLILTLLLHFGSTLSFALSLQMTSSSGTV